MSEPRESAILRAFVSLSESLLAGSDPPDLLTELTERCVSLLDIASAGLLLADDRGVLHVMAASSARTRELEIFQQQRDQGPCRDSYHLGRPVVADDLRAESGRWPEFSSRALAAGIASVHALPLRLRRRTLGALGLFGSMPGHLGDDDVLLGQALADVASIALVHDRQATDDAGTQARLRAALNSRVVIEQAKGVLAQRANLEMDVAFAALRGYARAHGRPLSEVAAGVTARELPIEAILRSRQAES